MPSRSYSGTGAYGLLWLQIDPEESKTSLDGQFVDLHVWLISIPPGSHELKVQKAGYRDYVHPFLIEGGQSLHLDIQLEKGSNTESDFSP
jgi:hypothetical protein